MPLKKRNVKKENKVLNELIRNNNDAKVASIEYDAIYNFRSLLIDARKKNDLSHLILRHIHQTMIAPRTVTSKRAMPDFINGFMTP